MSRYKTQPDALELIDDPLQLRPWHDDDASALFEAAHESIATVGQWLPWCRADYEMDDARAWISQCRSGWQDGELFAFAAFDARSGALLGGIGLNQYNRLQGSANLGYWIRQSCQGQGLAATAARLVARFGFEQLNLLRVEIVVSPENQPSRRTAEKTGAKFEGIARKRLWMAEQVHDAAVYALTAQDLA